MISIWRGTTRPIGWRFKDAAGALFDITGSTFLLSISARGAVIITKTSGEAGFVMDVPASTVTWTPTVDESRLIPEGAIASYELERRISGGQEILVSGPIEGMGGINADA
jgi:hypothetical protein